MSAIAFAPAPAMPMFNLGSSFTQPANLGPPVGSLTWINGILQQNNSLYAEGTSVPQRLAFDEITDTPTHEHVLTFEGDATKANIHAYDFLTSWAQAIEAAADKGPNGENLLEDLDDLATIVKEQGSQISDADMLALWDPALNPTIATGPFNDANLNSVGGSGGLRVTSMHKSQTTRRSWGLVWSSFAHPMGSP
jgi:hypothetical protein